jgi:DNA-binding GntR family transcriptional regulator
MDSSTVPADVLSWFHCKADAQFIRVVRIRAASKPVLLYISNIPAAIGRKFSKRDYARSSHHALIRQSDIRVASAEQIITAGLAKPIVVSQ